MLIPRHKDISYSIYHVHQVRPSSIGIALPSPANTALFPAFKLTYGILYVIAHHNKQGPWTLVTVTCLTTCILQNTYPVYRYITTKLLIPLIHEFWSSLTR